jgi:hypothetical protein
MCMQCVAQATPFVGVALTMLNRRTITSFAMTTWRRATGGVPGSDHEHRAGGTCEATPDPHSSHAGHVDPLDGVGTTDRDGCR